MSAVIFESIVLSVLAGLNLETAGLGCLIESLERIKAELIHRWPDVLVEHMIAPLKLRELKLLAAITPHAGLFDYAVVDGKLTPYLACAGLDQELSDRLVDYVEFYWLKRHPAWDYAAYKARVERLSAADLLEIRDRNTRQTYQMQLF